MDSKEDLKKARERIHEKRMLNIKVKPLLLLEQTTTSAQRNSMFRTYCLR